MPGKDKAALREASPYNAAITREQFLFRDIFHLFPNLDYITHIRRSPLKASICNGFKLCILCEEGDTFHVYRLRKYAIFSITTLRQRTGTKNFCRI